MFTKRVAFIVDVKNWKSSVLGNGIWIKFNFGKTEIMLWCTVFAVICFSKNSLEISLNYYQENHNNSMKILSLGFAPFVFRNNLNDFDGIDMKILKMITNQLNLDFSIEQMNVDNSGITDYNLR